MNLSVSTISPAYLRATCVNMVLSNNFVIVETDQTTHRCTAMLVNVSLHTQKLEVGQSITSQIFEMTCPKIGKALWSLIVFLNGQYEYERDNGQLSVYLKMIACERKNEKMLVDVKFFIESEETFSKMVPANTFHYENTRTRWVGTTLVSKSELYAQERCDYLVRKNNLVIGCRMIHPDIVIDECIVQNDVQLTHKQPWELKDVCNESLGISASSSLSRDHSHFIGQNDNRTTIPSASKFS